jgi:hypothetical protein
MAIINSYPTITPKAGDLVLITDTSTEGNPTKTASVSSIATIANSLNLGYTVYSALLTQTSTNAPVATVLQQTIPGTLTWSRLGIGNYVLTSNGTPFTANKTQVFINNGSGNTLSSGGSGTVYPTRWESTTTDTIAIATATTVASPQDGNLTNASIEIRVYN